MPNPEMQIPDILKPYIIKPIILVQALHFHSSEVAADILSYMVFTQDEKYNKSIGTIAKEIGISRTSVKEALADLIARRIIIPHKRLGYTTEYTLEDNPEMYYLGHKGQKLKTIPESTEI